MKWLSLILLLLTANVAAADPPEKPRWKLPIGYVAASADGDLKIVGPAVKVVLVVEQAPFTITAPTGGFAYQWTVPDSITATRKANSLDVTAAAKGEITVSVEWWVVDFDKRAVESKAASITFTVGEGPAPKPPDPPMPQPDPAPIPLDGFRVLFVAESSSKLPPAQLAILTSATLRDYLNKKCVKGSDGRAEWRQWDKDTPIVKEDKHWSDAMARPRQSLPWIIISNGKTGYEGPLPATVAETMTLLRKYGGD